MSDTDTERPSGTRRGLQLFDAADAVGIFESGTMSPPAFDPDDLAQVAEEQLDLAPSGDGLVDSVLFRGDGPDGFSLARADVGPNYVLPRHSHDSDCLYYVQEGSVHMGGRTIEAGSGFFVPADAPYAYETGPAGAVVLEFRTATSFDMKIPGGQIARFRKMAEAGAQNGETWRAHREAIEATRRPRVDASTVGG